MTIRENDKKKMVNTGQERGTILNASFEFFLLNKGSHALFYPWKYP